MHIDERYILIVKCRDAKGIVAAVSSYLSDNDASIVESNHFNDPISDQFYMRTVFRPYGPRMPDAALLKQGFLPIAHRFEMEWSLHDMAVKPRVMIAVSKFGHCLYDLLHRWRSGQLNVDIAAVVSNHEDMRSFVEWNGVPYHLVQNPKADGEARMAQLIGELNVDLLVLARYMQVLSPSMCALMAGRCINIHHSFLPSFKGAKPYHQAHARGVKMIGATSHYVTTELDEGPIIEQDVRRVDHRHTPEDLVAIGREVECSALARAVIWHIERRVVVNGIKTIVFS